MEKSTLTSSSLLLVQLGERFMKTLKGKDFSWHGTIFPSLAVTVTCHTETKKQNFICIPLSNICSIHKEELESSGSARSVFSSGYVRIIQWISEFMKSASQPMT